MQHLRLAFTLTIIMIVGAAVFVGILSLSPTRSISQESPVTLSVPPPETLPVHPTITLFPPIPTSVPTSALPTGTFVPTSVPTPVPRSCEAAKLLFAGALGKAQFDLIDRPTFDAVQAARRLVETGGFVLDACDG